MLASLIPIPTLSSVLDSQNLSSCAALIYHDISDMAESHGSIFRVELTYLLSLSFVLQGIPPEGLAKVTDPQIKAIIVKCIQPNPADR